jgi:very-short-patch-repair endonuclease
MKEGSRKEAIKRIMKKDAKQHYMLWSNGWTPLRFWQHEIEENPKWVIEQIKKNMFDKDYIKKREKQRKEYIAEIDEKGNIFLSKQ